MSRTRCDDHLEQYLSDPPLLHLHRPVAFWLVAFVLLIGNLGVTLPIPLYVFYQASYHFPDAVLTAIFGIYAAGTLAALLFFGHLSDQLGRKPVLLLAIALAAISTLLFLFAQGVPWLLAARFVSGFAAALLGSTATAALAELNPSPDERHASVVATVGNQSGLALGSVVAGFLSQYAPFPTELTFGAYLVLLMPTAACVLAAPETVLRCDPVSLAPRPVGVPREIRPTFITVAVAIFCAFSLVGLFSSLVPSFVRGTLHQGSHAVSGGLSFLFFATAAAADVAMRRSSSRTVTATGMLSVFAGLIAVVLGLDLASVALFVAGTVIAGAGVGLTFMGGLATLNQVTPSLRRGEVMSSFFVVANAGLAIPVMAIGVASLFVSPLAATIGCSAVIAALILAAMIWKRPPSGAARQHLA